ncbi:MAG: FtsW/RodA/SpoVE family cell cycle protein [Alphaproteobacteria bacterium]|nr:FtsW/RodA/SpoVE family cell cycle protein [Alphaproteobacteria bacterium]
MATRPPVLAYYTAVVRPWWRSIDHVMLGLVVAMICIGIVVQVSLNINDTSTITKVVFSAMVAVAIILLTSAMSPQLIHSVAALVLVFAVICLIWVLVDGVKIHGSRRWLEVANFRFQPSELVKASLAVVFARRIDHQYSGHGVQAFFVATLLFLLCAGLILTQPDISNVIIIALVFVLQWALAVSTRAIVILGTVFGSVGFFVLYVSFPHVAKRINTFLDPSSEPAWQVELAIRALVEGGYKGSGLGLGWTEYRLYSATNDFVFAALGEQLGLVFAALVILIIAGVIWRGIGLVLRAREIFTVLAVAGLLLSFGVQSIFNISSTLYLLPTDGNNLPFISSGRSSLFASAWAIGMVLALTRTPYLHAPPSPTAHADDGFSERSTSPSASQPLPPTE